MSDIRILLVDDDRAQVETLRRVLEIEGFQAMGCVSAQDALKLLTQRTFDAIVSDFRMAGMNGLELFMKVKERHPDVLFILVTAFASVETAVTALRSGVYDYITKPIDTDELVIKLRKALRYRRLETENVELKERIARLDEVEFIAASTGMKKVIESVEQIAPTVATVLVRGDSGTGKELVARTLHQKSPRASKPYVKVNCAAIPENLLEDELFGHVPGAFTGAVTARKGKFEVANGGTIFLDEIGDMPIHLQTKLLRVLQEREFERIGGNETVRVDVRVIAATNRDLAAMVHKGDFREDLYYRLAVIPLHIPPLRERPEDIAPLANHFLAKFCRRNGRELKELSAAALSRLTSYGWPGNVRELENTIERAVVLARGDELTSEDFVFSGETKADVVSLMLEHLLATDLDLDGLMTRLILGALERCDGNVSRTARALGLTRRTLQYRIDKIREGGDDPLDAPETDHE